LSRWLKSVNNLLENLDSGVGNVVENQAELYEDMEDEVGGQSSVDDILAKRGLLAADMSHDDDDDDDDDDGDGNDDKEDEDEVENMDFIVEETEHDLETDSTSPDDADGVAADEPADQEEGYVNEEDVETNEQVSDGRNEVNETFDTAFDQSFDQGQFAKENDAADADDGQGVTLDESQKDASEEKR